MVATIPRQTPTSIWELIRSAHTAMFLGGVVAFIGAALKIVPYIALVEIGRGFLNGASAAHHWGWFTAAVVSMVIHGIAYTGALGATHIAEANLRNKLRLKLVNKLPRVPLGWVNDRSSGQINRAVIGDTEQIHTLVAHLAGDMMNSAGTVVAGFGYLLWLDARFAGLLILAWLLLLGMSTLPATKGMKQSFDEYSAAQRELSAVTVEMVDGIKEVKNFGMTADVFGRFDAAARNHADVTMNWMRRSGVSMAIMAAVMQPAAMLALTIGLGFWFFHLGWVTPITVVAFATAVASVPGVSPRRSADSVLIRDVMTKGPHCNCTSAITLSFLTAITSPVKRLRAEVGVPSVSTVACRACWKATRSRPSMLRCPPSRDARSTPRSMLRLRVSSLTPISWAASRMLKVVMGLTGTSCSWGSECQTPAWYPHMRLKSYPPIAFMGR